MELREGKDMKLRFMAEITDDNGNRVVAPIEVEKEIPDLNEFEDSSQFYEVFNRYEKPALDARNGIAEEITRLYLDAAADLKKDGEITEL